jgi:serine-type D-Ala-D-Ala carboxypeptidase (penicillin-binding protein 5/6)
LRKVLLGLLLVLVLIAGGAGVYVQRALARPIPQIVPTSSFPTTRAIEGQPPALPWPQRGAAAVSVPKLGVIGTFGGSASRPIASIAKAMTAHIILRDRPLAPGEQGPMATVTQEDVNIYLRAVREGESTLPVVAGAQFTEYQMLQGLMLPSGNNIAELLARWDAGTREAFMAKMNARAAELGMTATHFEDPSGVSPRTVSTPRDLILLGRAAMQDPVFAEIVAQREATLPVAGRVFNVNTSLGVEGNVGIKTGSTPEAGSCLLFSARRTIGGEELLIVGAVLDQNLLTDAFERSAQLAIAAANGVRTTRVLSTSEVVGSYTSAWGAQADIVPAEDVEFLSWPGMTAEIQVQLEPLDAPAPKGTRVGTLTISLGEQTKAVDLVTTAILTAPDQNWRLLRPLRERGLIG